MNFSTTPNQSVLSEHFANLNLSENSLKTVGFLERKIFDQFHCFSSLAKGETLPEGTCEFSLKMKRLLERIHSSFGYISIEGIVRSLCARLDEDVRIPEDARIMFKDWVNDEFGLLIE